MYSKLKYIDNDEDNIIYGNRDVIIVIKKSDWLNKKINNLNITLLGNMYNTRTETYRSIVDRLLNLSKDELDRLSDMYNQKNML